MKTLRAAWLLLISMLMLTAGGGPPALSLPPVTPAKRIAAGEIERVSQELATVGTDKTTDPWLVISPTAQLAVRYRNASGRAEMHRTTAEIIFIKGGKGHLQLGGELESPSGPDNEPRAESIRGGDILPAAPGDIFNIPPNTPHRFLLDAGETVSYLNIKIDATSSQASR